MLTLIILIGVLLILWDLDDIVKWPKQMASFNVPNAFEWFNPKTVWLLKLKSGYNHTFNQFPCHLTMFNLLTILNYTNKQQNSHKWFLWYFNLCQADNLQSDDCLPLFFTPTCKWLPLTGDFNFLPIFAILSLSVWNVPSCLIEIDQ